MGNVNVNDNFIDDIGIEIIIKKKSDILNEIKFNNEEERLLCDSIITDIEKTAASAIIHNKSAQLPLMGVMRKSPLKAVVNKNRPNFSVARTHMTKQQYKEYVGEIMSEAKIEIEKEDKAKARIRKIKSKHKKQYDEYYKQLGQAYATMFIYSFTIFKEVPFDADVQAMFDELNEN